MKGKTMFSKTLKAGAFAAALALPGFAFGQAAPAPAADAKPAEAKPEEPKAPYTLTGNFGLFSQYIFRGLSQTNQKPAAQGGFDFAHESGFYLGTWASNISWPKENASVHNNPPGVNNIAGTYEGAGSLEWDFYGGYKWSLPQDFGTLYYWYPGDTSATYNNLTRASLTRFGGAPKLDTWEVYLAGTWKWASIKYSYSVLDHTFGALDSRGTGYLDISANPPLGDTGLTLNLHWGWQKYKGSDPRNCFAGPVVSPVATCTGAGSLTYVPSNDQLLSYKDVKVGLSYALPKDFTIGAFWSKGFSSNKAGYGGVNDLAYGTAGTGTAFYGPYPKDIAASTGTVFIQKTF
jgi:uncharacterized protein (TIGR02001 family)